MTSATAHSNLERFQYLLRELFQFDCADLDFGIYRIMNHKRDVIARFIDEKLPAAVAAQLDSGPLAEQARAQSSLEDAARRVRENLASDAIDEIGNLDEQYHGTQAGRDYLAAQNAAAGCLSRDTVEAEIYNRLWAFFSRYYEEGDFISKRRYSRNERYAIPYNGEEVYLHWANSDQYYVKTDEHFRNYDWKALNGVVVRFRLDNADIEQNNVKGDDRLFLPLCDKSRWDDDSRTITIPFEYRPLNRAEKQQYGKGRQKQQNNIIAGAITKIQENLPQQSDALAALTGEARRNSNGPVSHLEHHLRRYVARNNADFFIHKDLYGFLNRELDFYLKNEVLNLDYMITAGQDLADGWFQTLRLVKQVGSQVIDFLAQIENFQKTLYEKRKFVTETQYCITLGNIAAEFYPNIVDNDEQWEEWRELFAIEGGNRSTAFLRDNPTLVVDTKHFASDFTDNLMASFDDLDGVTNGVLVHGDNRQALRLLAVKYHGKVQCIYIDPPFNTDTDQFFYKDQYRHSSWLAMMEAGLQSAKELLASSGTLYAHIDYNEKERLKLMLDRHFTYITEIIWRIGWVSGFKSAANKFIRNHDTIYQYGKTDSPLFIKTYIPYPDGYTRRDGNAPQGKGYPLEDTWNCDEIDQLHSIQIMSFSREKVGDQSLTQKNENLVARMVRSSSGPDDVVLDYFLGSGTTAAVAHKMGRKYIGIEMNSQFLDFGLPRMKRVLHGDPYGVSTEAGWQGGGMFKYILLESYEDALDSIEFDQAVSDAQQQLAEPDDEYLLKYMLRCETKDSATLLNSANLTSPFAYRLRAHVNGEKRERKVDLPETFNYLLGLNVRTRQAYDDNGRRYLVYRGETRDAPGQSVAVIWRGTEGWSELDFDRDRDFVADCGLTDGANTVYVNGDFCIPNARPIEPMFEARMFAGVDV